MGGGASKQKAVSPPVNTVKSVNTNSELASAQKVNSETTLVQECSNQPHSKPSSEQASIKLPQILDKKHHDNALKNEHVPAKDAPTQNKVITDTGLNNDAIVSEPSEQQNSIGTEILDTGQETEDHNSTYEQQDVHLPEFAQTIRWCNEMVTSHSILHQATDDLLHLQISRSLPAHIDISELLNKLHNLQSLDLSKQLMGPQAFRAIVLGMAQNTFITQLNLANNQTDTDSAACLGSMLSSNATLQYLDVSGNNLGKDYFSRCVGKAMENNNTLTTLICDGIGSTDMLPLVASFQGNCRLTELNVSHNEFTEGAKFIQELNKSLKNQDCCLKTLEMKCCGFTGDDFKILQEGISKNSSLITLNLAANQVSTTGIFMDFLVCCISHPTLEHVTLDDTRIQSAGAWKPAGGTQPHTTESSLYHLSLSACGITDKIAEQLLNVTGSLRSLKELTLNNNPELTVKGVGTVMKLSNGGIEKLSLALCSITNVSDILTNNDCLKYLNLRKCKISAAEVGKIGGLTKRLRMFTLVLDGLKLSGSKAIEKLVDDSSSDLVALSLGGCQLSDEDVKPLISAIKSGLPLSMLKLSGNRVTDVTIDGLIESIGQSAIGVHQMKLLDISNNKITSVGARKISEALENSKTVLHSLNLSHNNIDYEGICSLVSKVNITTLLTLQLNDQQETLEDEESDDVCKQLAQTLGFSVPDQVEDLCADSSELPEIKSGVFVKLSGLGGFGTYAQYLDCAAILTDLEKSNVRTLCLSDALKITAYLKGQAGGESCLLSASEWTDIIGSSGDVPSWLQVSDSRACGLYLTFLPAAVTVPKLEGTLESDADCNVQEVYLMKDVISKKNTGVGWALLSDVESTQRAVEYMRNGEALIFSQPFLISKIDVKINDEENSKAAEKAKRDIAARVANQAKDSNAHRKLIAQSYQTSQARYAHQLANPAYTDGRVW